MINTANAPSKPTTTPTTNPTRRATTARLFSFNTNLPDTLVHYAPECAEVEFSEVVKIHIQFTSDSHLHLLHCAPEPIKHKELMKCTRTL